MKSLSKSWMIITVAAALALAGCEYTGMTDTPARGPSFAKTGAGTLAATPQGTTDASPPLATGPAAAAAVVALPKKDPNHKPVLYCIGDSTMKNGADNGSNGQWGYGHMLHYYFDETRITVENDAVGGTSSRTFMKTANMWPRVLAKIQPGDFVLMQFGHNDNTGTPQNDTLRYRSTIKGNGDEVVDGVIQGGGTEPVHSFGWYMRQYCIQTREKGGTPIVVSFIPRNSWQGGRKVADTTSYSLWAQQAAEQEHAFFVPLNKLVTDEYNKLGQQRVTAEMFPQGESTHTTWAGAVLNAQCVVAGIKELKDCPLKEYLVATPKVPETPDVTAGRGRGAQ